jgi:hypothetical protein
LQASLSYGITGHKNGIGDLANGILGGLLNVKDAASIGTSGIFGGMPGIKSSIMALFLIIMMGYAIIKVFFANLKRGGILIIQIAVGSLYMFSVPREYVDGFLQWTKKIIGLCLTSFLQATILAAGLMVLKDHALLGLGLMLSAGEVPRIAGAFGLDTSTKTNIMGAVHEITDYSIKTPAGELIYFIIRPTNISVLSDASVSARIYALMTVLKGIAEIEMLCLNSKENFDENKCRY